MSLFPSETVHILIHDVLAKLVVEVGHAISSAIVRFPLASSARTRQTTVDWSSSDKLKSGDTKLLGASQKLLDIAPLYVIRILINQSYIAALAIAH